MLRFFTVLPIVLAPVVNPVHAWAEDAEALISTYYDLRPKCRQPEDADALPTEAETKAACEKLNMLGRLIVAAGYCWDHSEQEWSNDKARCRS